MRAGDPVPDTSHWPARAEDGPAISVADLPPGLSLFGLARKQAELEAIIGTRVDLVPAQDLKPGVRARVEEELIALRDSLPGEAPATDPDPA